MSNDLVTHYQELLRKHGDSSESLQHFDQASQYKRFEALCAPLLKPGARVLDIGCGLGHLLDYLKATGRTPARYLGIDIVPEFVEMAQQKRGQGTESEFRVVDIHRDTLNERFDHVIICGIFNNTMPDNWGFLESTVRKAFALTDGVLSYNLLSTYVDYENPELFYADPLRAFDFAKRQLSRKVDLNHSYVVKAGSIPYEYTLHVRPEKK